MNDEISVVKEDALDPSILESQLKVEKDRRKIISSYIKTQLKKGVDYGTIKMGVRESKPCLFKPGSEKFCSLLQLTAVFDHDATTYEVIKDAFPGTICYVCRLVHNATGKIVSEGRGACNPKEKAGVVNTSIKIAEKRAQIDAVLRLGLSDVFTQDLEDLEESKKAFSQKAPQEVQQYSSGKAVMMMPRPYKKPSEEPEESSSIERLDAIRKSAGLLKVDSARDELEKRMRLSGNYTENEILYAVGKLDVLPND